MSDSNVKFTPISAAPLELSAQKLSIVQPISMEECYSVIEKVHASSHHDSHLIENYPRFMDYAFPDMHPIIRFISKFIMSNSNSESYY